PVREHDGRHPGAAVGTGDLHAVDVGLGDAGRPVQHVADLLRGDVLSLPAEGVADAIDEVEVPGRVAAEEIAAPKPHVAALEGVAHELPLARRAVAVSIVLHGARPAHAPEQLPGLVHRAGRAEAVGTADELSPRQVESGEAYLVLEHRMRL